MTTPETELTRVFEAYASDVDARPDLYQQVGSRYRRRRLRRTLMAGVATGLVIILAVAGVVVAAPRHVSGPTVTTSSSPSPSCTDGPRSCDTSKLPVVPPFKPGHWKAPQTPIPPALQTWPDATFHAPVKGPGGAKISPLERIDATHVLVTVNPGFEASGTLYSYDLTSGGFRKITDMPKKSVLVNRWAFSDHFVVWGVDGTNRNNVFKNGVDVYKAPLSGGPAQLVAHVDIQSPETSNWYATDDAVYWSYETPSPAGVFELPLGGGKPAPVPGFADMQVVDASGWTVHNVRVAGGTVTTALKQLGSGRTLTVATQPDMVELSCAPTFCIGEFGHFEADGNVWRVGTTFIQDLDGGHRMAIPKGFIYGSVTAYPTGDRGVVVINQNGMKLQIWDPASGAAGSLAATEDAQHSSRAHAVNDICGYRNGKTGVWTYVALGAL